MKRTSYLCLGVVSALLSMSFVLGYLGWAGEKRSPEKVGGALLALPSDGRSGLRYVATKLTVVGPGAARNRSRVVLEFSIYSASKDTVSASIHRLDAEVMRGGRKVALNSGVVKGKTFGFKRRADGTKPFLLLAKRHENPESEAVAEVLRDDILPLLVPGLPKGFKPEVGFSWGEAAKEDSLKDFTTHPKCVTWKVDRVVRIAGKHEIVHVGSYVEDKLKLPKRGTAVSWRCIGICYDAILKRVRQAHDFSTCLESTGDPEASEKTRHRTMTICEVTK